MFNKIINNLRWWLSRRNTNSFWSSYNVTLHTNFKTREQSINYFNWRNAQYLFYEDLMPTYGLDDKTILDYGCGPCHDIVGFLENSQPAKLVGADISDTSLQEGKNRLHLHKALNTKLIKLDETSTVLPFNDAEFDYIHSSGVLHHIETSKMSDIIKEFNRILKPDGFIRIMIYNYNSIWLHLNAAYILKILGNMNDKSLNDVFRVSTDTMYCPISHCYKSEDFIAICRSVGLEAKLLGCAVAIDEIKLLPRRFDAIQDIRLPEEHRKFLLALEFDKFGRPLFNGQVAGHDAVYELRKA